jgi:hypothetical protein
MATPAMIAPKKTRHIHFGNTAHFHQATNFRHTEANCFIMELVKFRLSADCATKEKATAIYPTYQVL